MVVVGRGVSLVGRKRVGKIGGRGGVIFWGVVGRWGRGIEVDIGCGREGEEVRVIVRVV